MFVFSFDEFVLFCFVVVVVVVVTYSFFFQKNQRKKKQMETNAFCYALHPLYLLKKKTQKNRLKMKTNKKQKEHTKKKINK
jgi:hypothetical protein